MGIPKYKPNLRFSYKDYCGWDDGERWELIDGTAYNMTPAPARFHQSILGELFAQLHAYLKDKPGKVYPAPFDVRFPDGSMEEEYIFNVVQPDITVICNFEKLDDRGCLGAPDLIVEILSPSTVAKDNIRKLELYEKYAVPEYWLIHHVDRIVTVYTIDSSGHYKRPKIYGEDDIFKSVVLKGFELNPASIFEA